MLLPPHLPCTGQKALARSLEDEHPLIEFDGHHSQMEGLPFVPLLIHIALRIFLRQKNMFEIVELAVSQQRFVGVFKEDDKQRGRVLLLLLQEFRHERIGQGLKGFFRQEIALPGRKGPKKQSKIRTQTLSKKRRTRNYFFSSLRKSQQGNPGLIIMLRVAK